MCAVVSPAIGVAQVVPKYAGSACWAQDASVPPEPAQTAVWQYYRPKCDGGPLQQHLDVFKGYTRYAQYPAKTLADMDWEAIVRKVLSAQTGDWGAEEVSKAALQWARLACPEMTKRRLGQLQCLGAWTMDYCYTASRVQQNRAKACVDFIPVPNASYYAIALASGMQQTLQELGVASNAEAIGNVFEVAAAAAFAAADFAYLGSHLLELDKVSHMRGAAEAALRVTRQRQSSAVISRAMPAIERATRQALHAHP